MRNADGAEQGRFSLSETNASDPQDDPSRRWRAARERYADMWSKTILQDRFRVYVYPSSDSEFLREIDIAADAPEIAEAIATATGSRPAPHDLLISLGWRMGNRKEPNDPETWAAIDAGQFACFNHLGTADRRMNWEQRTLLLAAAATVVMIAHPDGRAMTYSDIDATGAEAAAWPKVELITQYLTSDAAFERYLDDGPRQDLKIQIARFCEDHEMTCRTMQAIADVALNKPASWAVGPLPTETIAGKAAELLVDAYRHVMAPGIARTPARPAADETRPAA